MTIVEFITHRLAEAEVVVAEGNGSMDPVWKRLVALLIVVFEQHDVISGCVVTCFCGDEWPCRTARMMAGLWQEHEDFNPDWSMP